jgi:hypothetical protein
MQSRSHPNLRGRAARPLRTLIADARAPPRGLHERLICALPAAPAFSQPGARNRRSARCVLSDHPQPRHSACSLSLDQAQSLRAQARASRGSSCMPCNSRPWPGVARGGSTSSFVGRLSPTVVPNRWPRAPDLAPRSSLAILVGPRRPAQRPRPPLPLRGEPRSPASSARCLLTTGCRWGLPWEALPAKSSQARAGLAAPDQPVDQPSVPSNPVFRCRSR